MRNTHERADFVLFSGESVTEGFVWVGKKNRKKRISLIVGFGMGILN